jgi:hypothetical protein
MSTDLRDRGRIFRAKCVMQFLRLTLELIQIRMLANFASGQAAIHNELLSLRLRDPRQRDTRCPLARAEKRSLKTTRSI